MAKDDLKILRNWIDAKSSLNIKHKSKIKIVVLGRGCFVSLRDDEWIGRW